MVLAATYTGGNTIRVDLTEVVQRLEAFAPLESRREFRRATVVDFGWGVEWPCGASLDSDRWVGNGTGTVEAQEIQGKDRGHALCA